MHKVKGSIPVRGTFLKSAGHFTSTYIWMLGALYALWYVINTFEAIITLLMLQSSFESMYIKYY